MQFNYKGFDVEIKAIPNNKKFPWGYTVQLETAIVLESTIEGFCSLRDAYMQVIEQINYYMACNNIPDPDWTSPQGILNELRLHIAEAKMQPDNEVWIDGKLVGYWQTTEWLNKLLKQHGNQNKQPSDRKI